MTEAFPPELRQRFEPLRTLGIGGFGAVWLANQVELSRHVALKLLNAEHAADSGEVERFLQEARITASLSHPAVVKVFDFGIIEMRPWIAYELLEGEPLSTRLDRELLPCAEAARVLAVVARGLAAAHELGIVHRDIKPDNLFACRGGEVKLTDFGIARWSQATRVRTATGVVMGTPAFVAPELIGGSEPSAASDVYALGVTFFQLVTGRLPFEGDSLVEVLKQHLEARPPPPSSLVAGMPAGADELVRIAMAKAPEKRYRSALELADAFERLGRGTAQASAAAPVASRSQSDTVRLPPSRPGAERAAAAPTRPSRRLAAGATLVAVICAVLVAVRWQAPRREEPRPTPSASAAAVPATASPVPLRQLRVTRFDMLMGATTARIQIRLDAPARLELRILTAEPPHAPVRARPMTAEPVTHCALEVDGLREQTRYMAVVLAEGRELMRFLIRTESEKHVYNMLTDLKHLVEPEDFSQMIAGGSLYKMVDDRVDIPLSRIARAIRELPVNQHATTFVDMVEQREAANLAELLLASKSLVLNSTHTVRLLRMLAEDGRRDVGLRLEAWRQQLGATYADAVAQESYIHAWMELEGLDADAMAGRVTFTVVPNEGLARDMLARSRPQALELFRRWLREGGPRSLMGLLGVFIAGTADEIAGVLAKQTAQGKLRREVAGMLAASPHPGSRERLLAELKLEPPLTDLCWALARRPDPRSVPYLSKWIAAPHPVELRVAALCALGRQGDSRVAPALVEQLEGGDDLVRRAAAWALARLGPAARGVSIPALRAVASSERDTDGIAGWALGQLADPGQCAFLCDLAHRLALRTEKRDHVRSGLALLAAWRLSVAEVRNLLAAPDLKGRKFDAFLDRAISLCHSTDLQPEYVEVVFPFALFDRVDQILSEGQIVDARVFNHFRPRGPGGELGEVPDVSMYRKAHSLEPSLYMERPYRLGKRRACLLSQLDGQPVVSPVTAYALRTYESFESADFGGASLIYIRPLWTPGR